MRVVRKALTFDDVLLVPAHSVVVPRDVSLKTRLTGSISLNIPLVAAAMDTVTEARLAIAIAQTLGPSIENVILALSITYWPFWARLVFAETRSLKNEVFIESAIALGASAGGIARSSLQALEAGGRAGAVAFFERIETELKTAMLLVGAKDLDGLRRAPKLVRGELAEWMKM